MRADLRIIAELITPGARPHFEHNTVRLGILFLARLDDTVHFVELPLELFGQLSDFFLCEFGHLRIARGECLSFTQLLELTFKLRR